MLIGAPGKIWAPHLTKGADDEGLEAFLGRIPLGGKDGGCGGMNLSLHHSLLRFGVFGLVPT